MLLLIIRKHARTQFECQPERNRKLSSQTTDDDDGDNYGVVFAENDHVSIAQSGIFGTSQVFVSVSVSMSAKCVCTHNNNTTHSVGMLALGFPIPYANSMRKLPAYNTRTVVARQAVHKSVCTHVD